MYTVEMKLTICMTPEEYEDRDRLIQQYVKDKKQIGYKRVRSAGEFALPKFQFDANYNSYYCILIFVRK